MARSSTRQPARPSRTPSSSRSNFRLPRPRSLSSTRSSESEFSHSTHTSDDEHGDREDQHAPRRRPRLALTTTHRAPHDLILGPGSDSELSTPPSPTHVSPKRRSYSSVIHFDRPASIHLSTLADEKPQSRASESRRSRRSSRAHGADEEEAGARKRKEINFKIIFIALMLLATVTSLDNTTVYQFVSYATSSFAEHSALGIIQTAQAIAIAESLLIGLSWSFVVAIVLYTAGYAVIAASPSIAVYAVGTIVAQLGNASLVSLQSTAIFQYSASLASNALLNSLLTTPYYVTGWVGSFIVERVLAIASWRWGYGMFCIMTPALILPLLVLLFVDQRRKARSPAPSTPAPQAHPPPSPTRSISSTTAPLALPSRRARLKSKARALVGEETHAGRLDALGLVLLALALSGLLIPLTLLSQGALTAVSAPFLAPLLGGALALAALLWHERRAACPLFPLRVFRTRRTVVCLAATALNMTSFFLLLTFQYSFSEQFTLMLAHLAISFPVKALVRRQTAARGEGKLQGWLLRWPMVWTSGGHGVRVVGVGLMILSRGVACAPSSLSMYSILDERLTREAARAFLLSSGPVWLLVLSQVIHGAGGAVTGVFCMQVAMAAAPTQDDVSMVWALILLVGDVGNAVGTALATLLWQHFLPLQLASHLSATLSTEEIDAVFHSTEIARSYPTDSAASEGIREAYAAVMRLLLYVALGLALASFVLSLAMGPASVAERETPEVEGAAEKLVRDPGPAGRMSLAQDGEAERALGKGRRRREGRYRYARWARKPVGKRSDGEETDSESEWSEEEK
ncbi:hypothetical protein JCM10450v2_000920 [Rhodotorula kratochvilovae]